MTRSKFAILFLTITHLTGVLGLHYEVTRDFFLFFMPFNLLLSFGLLLYFHEEWKKGELRLLVLWGILGYLIEVLGVKTGFPFGSYSYGTGLGVKLFDVSIVMAINWATMLYCTHVIAWQWSQLTIIRIVLASGLMTAVDVLIEPIADHLEMWHWANGTAPLINFAAWFGLSLGLHALGAKFQFRNEVAKWYLVILILFFGMINIMTAGL